MEDVDIENVCTTRFEHLIGERGGGSRESQLYEILRLADHLALPFSLGDAESVAEQLFGDTWTFRSGKISGWKSHFSKYQKNLFKKKWGIDLIDLGYEKGLEW